MLPLLSIQSVTKSFGVRTLFEEISVVLSEKEKVGLIGPNGSGKTTLLRIIAGLDQPDSGEVAVRKHLRVGYVPQHDNLPADGTVADALYHELPSDVSQPGALVASCLTRAGFNDQQQPVTALSGGWRKRLAIARALLCDPELLLLDEPTNHLDIDGVLWLEDLLHKMKCTVLFISHDRYFLENTAERVVELDRRYPKGFLSVTGRYSDFLATRAEFLDQLQSYRESLANKVRREVEWLRQGAKARTTKAKGRIKEAGRLIDELSGLSSAAQNANLEFSASGRKSKELIKTEKLSKALGGRTLFNNLDFLLAPRDRVGIVGSNGSGKTTLLRTLLKELPPDQGSVWHAQHLRVAFFDQSREQLNPEETLLKALCNEGDAVVFNGKEIHVSGWARRFLFSTAQLGLKVSQLSGGEQARLLIARLMLLPADVLVLDEPTNDLDISTLEVLEESLRDFAGGVLLVTHDRYMLDRVCTSVLGLAGNGRAECYADYRQWELVHEVQPAREKQRKVAPTPPAESCPVSEKSKGLSYSERLELQGIEQKILDAETVVEKLQVELCDPAISGAPEKLRANCEKLSAAQRAVDDLFARWHELESKKEALKAPLSDDYQR
jgi:ABC transport system ATP-binding/permease protein